MKPLRTRPSHQSARSGFTLVELMVSVVIVAALASIGAVVANSVKVRSQEARCLSNMRNIGIALHLHTQDHAGRFPETSHTVGLDKAWIEALRPYLGEYDQIRICPADPRRNERLEAGGTSYVLNSFIFVPEVDAWGQTVGPALNRPAAIPDASRTLLAFVCSDRIGAGPGNDHTHSNLWGSWSGVCSDIAPSRFGGSDEPLAADGRSNYLYADGRVESIRAAVLKKKTDSGINIAQLPGL